MSTQVSKRQYILRGVLIGLIIILSLFGIGCFLLQNAVTSIVSVMSPAIGIIQIQDVKDYIGIPLPSGINVFQGEYFAFMQSRILYFKFQADTKIAESFLKQLGLNDPLIEGVTPFSESSIPPETDLTWWNTDAIANFSGASWIKSGTFYDVLVDTSNLAFDTVYLKIEQM